MKSPIPSLIIIFLMLSAAFAQAAPIKLHIAKVSAPGAANRDELQSTLQTLLASRLDSEAVTTVATAAEAQAILNVSYITFGKIFSLEAVAKSSEGVALSRAFAQGESQDELIPAVGRMAEKLKTDLAKAALPPAPSSVSSAPLPAQAAAPVVSGIVKIAERVKESDIWRSQQIPGVMNLVAAGQAGKDGARDIFITDNRRLYHYRSGGEELQLKSEKELKLFEKIIALDCLETSEGTDIYLTVMANDQLSSQIWQLKNGNLQLAASGLPYYFRVMSLPGSARQLYVQKSSATVAFSGDVYRAERKGAEIVTGESIKIPAGSTIYSFCQFVAAKSGKIYTVTISSDNQLTVFDPQLREIWRSVDKYGGSELYMERGDQTAIATADQGQPRIYLNQRLHATSGGDIIVGKNEALSLIGKNWNQKNGAVFSLAWTGSSLEPRWRTVQSDYYMPDYSFDDASRELLQLQVISRPFLFSKGATMLTIRKTE